MEETIKTYRDEIADISSLLTLYLVQDKNSHYEVRGGAYAPQPYINVITTDIDYFDGTILSNLIRIVEKNIKKTWYTYHLTGYTIIVTTQSGTMIDADGVKLTFNFYEINNMESK